MVMKPAHVPFHLNEGLDLFAILTFVGVNKACCKRTSKATFRKAQISNKLIFSHHDKNSIKYARLILICMIIHLSKGWWAIKCNKITRKHFVRVFKVLCSGNGFLQPPSKKERENLFTKTFYNRLEQVSKESQKVVWSTFVLSQSTEHSSSEGRSHGQQDTHSGVNGAWELYCCKTCPVVHRVALLHSQQLLQLLRAWGYCVLEEV